MDIFTALKSINAKTGSFAMSGNSGYSVNNLTAGAEAAGYTAVAVNRGGTYSVSYAKKPEEKK